ncbi:uncharacterized protein [Acropora muricata]
MQVKSCHSADLISICTQEIFLLIFLEMSSVVGHAQKLCSTIRYNPNSLNRTVAIIGIMEEGSKDDFGSYGLNDIIYQPVTDKTMNQVLLKWAGHKSCEGMPMTPSSPGDRVPVVAVMKATESIRESKQSSASLPNYNNNPDISPSVQQSCNSISEADNCVTESYKPSQLQLNQAVAFHPQSYNSVQGGSGNGIPISNRGLASLAQSHLTTNDSGLGQLPHTQVSSSISALQHFVQGGYPCQDQQPPSLFLSRSAPDHIPVHSGLVPAHITSMVNAVYPPEHSNQSFIYHSTQSLESSKLNTAPHFVPINSTSHHSSAHSSNSAGFGSGHDAPSSSKAEQSPVSSTHTTTNSTSNKGVGSPAYMISGALGSKDMKITLLHEDMSKHSSKERIRRERIKDSCDQLRFLLPSVAGKKSDMASILEMTVKYVRMVKERLPPPVLQEISDNIIDTSPVLPRKRSRDTSGSVKQGRPRLTPTSSIPTIHDGAPRLAHPLQPFYMRPAPFQPKAPTIVTTTGPMYVPHLHMRPGHEHPQIPLQQHIVHPPEPAGFRTVASPPSAFNSCSAARNVRNANVMQHIPPHEHTTMNLHQDCSAPLSTFHSKHMYHSSHQTVPTRGHSYDIPQQWSFLKLPAIGNIFHSLSSTTLSTGNSEADSCDSNTSSPSNSSSMTPPLWENSGSMIGSRVDQTHLESPTLYKGTSV